MQNDGEKDNKKNIGCKNVEEQRDKKNVYSWERVSNRSGKTAELGTSWFVLLFKYKMWRQNLMDFDIK
jgi:hypothetical protein